MNYNHKKADSLTIQDKKVTFYAGYYFDIPIIISFGLIPQIHLNQTKDRTSISANLSVYDLQKDGYTDLAKLLRSIRQNVYIKYNNGACFYGDVSSSIENGTVKILPVIGRAYNRPAGWKEIEIKKEGNNLMVVLSDNPENSLLKKEIFYIPLSSNIPKNPILHISQMYELMNHIRWEYRDGDIFEGEASATVSSDTISTHISIGKYTYSNGDYFEGDISGEYFYGMPIDGTTYFKNHTVQRGNWLANNYNLTKKQYSKLQNLRFPSAVRDSAIVLHNDNIYNGYISAAKQSELEKKYALAKQYYQKAQSLKPNAEKWDEKMKALDKNIEKEQRKKD